MLLTIILYFCEKCNYPLDKMKKMVIIRIVRRKRPVNRAKKAPSERDIGGNMYEKGKDQS